MAAISPVIAVIQTVGQETRVSEQKQVSMCTPNPEVKEQRSHVTFKNTVTSIQTP